MTAQGDNVAETLKVIDFDELPNAFVRTEQISIKVAGKSRLVDICTADVDRISRQWRRENPKPLPPYKEEKVEEGTSRAFRVGHTKGLGIVKVYDEEDAQYQEKLEEWSDRHNYYIVAHVIDLELRKGGIAVTDLKERADMLRNMGMTSSHANVLAKIVLSLEAMEIKEAVSFFVGGSE